MNEWIKLILSLSLSGTSLILLLFLLRPLYRERFSKRWQYYIWLVVILRLLLPITPQVSLTGSIFRAADSRSPAVSFTQERQNTYESSDTDTGAGTEQAVDDGSTDVAFPESPAGAAGSAPSFPFVFMIWLTVALLLFVRKVTLYQSFVKYIDAGSRPLDEIVLLERFGHIMENNHIAGAIDLRVNSLVSSPLLIGLIRPRIVLPHTDLSEDDFYYTMLHELTHYQRKDMFYKWLVQLTVCLHWFNPLVYLMAREVNRLCELSCDERVISRLAENARKSYGATLVNAVGAGGAYQDRLASVTLNESKELLKGRLDAIIRYRKLSRPVQFLALFFTGFLIGGAVVLGAYAAPGGKSDSGLFDHRQVISSTPDNDMQSSPDTSAGGGSPSGHAGAYSDVLSSIDYDMRYEDGIYYFHIDGATQADEPLSNVTEGYRKLVFVWKDRYTTFGTFRDKDMPNLVRNIESQCRTLLANGQITQEDMDLYLLIAEDLQNSWLSLEEQSATVYNFNVQGSYYQKPYIVELGYTQNQSALFRTDYRSRTVTLADQTAILLYYDAEYEQALSSDEKALDIVTAAIERMLTQGNTDDVKVVILVDLEYVGNESSSSLAQKFYEEENLLYFSAVFRELDRQTKLQYLDRMFADDKIACFSCCIDKLGDSGTQKEAVERYILKAYEEDRISFFFLLSDMLDEENRKQWLERCRKDGKTLYLSAFDEWDGFDDWDDFDEWDNFDDWDDFEKWDARPTGKAFLEEYNQNGIVTVKDDYYYQNARVRILMDVRPDGSFENFDYNDRGTVDLRLVRDDNNKISRVEYLSAEEAAEIMDDLDDTLSDKADETITPRTSSASGSSAPMVMDLTRVTRAEVSDKVRTALEACEDGKWYVIEADDSQYIYYNGLPRSYAYEPQIDGSEKGDLITVDIVDIGTDSPLLRSLESAGNYVLLAFSYHPLAPDASYELAIRYNHIPVTYTRSQAK